jgi:hypothetical protein
MVPHVHYENGSCSHLAMPGAPGRLVDETQRELKAGERLHRLPLRASSELSSKLIIVAARTLADAAKMAA